MHDFCAPVTESVILHFIALVATGPTSSYLCQPANPWISLLWGYWGYLGAPVANEQFFGCHCFGATWGYLGVPFANQQIFDFIALGATGPTSSYLCRPANPWISLLWGYWGYLGAPFANQQILELHCFGATGATSGPPLPTSKSLDFIALGLLGLPRGPLCQPANP